MRLLVLQSAGDVADLAQRCARWAEATGVDVEVAAPAGTPALTARLRDAGWQGFDGVVLERPADPTPLAGAVEDAGVPVVAVARGCVADRSGPLDRACVRVIHGRGRGGYRWALRHLHARAAGPWRVWAYGPEADQVGDLRVPPTTPARGAPLAVVFHGGFWRDEWERDLMDAVAVDLTARGWITWNVEYRRATAGWRACLDDAEAVVAAVDQLPAPVDTARVVLLGHSAGAQLALCAASQGEGERQRAGGRGSQGEGELQRAGGRGSQGEGERQRAGGWGSDRHIVVGLAPLTDLDAAARGGVGWGSVTDFLGDPDRHPWRYRRASPAARLPLGFPQMFVHGLDDRHVPVAMTRTYMHAARRAGDRVELAEVPATDHFQIIDPGHASWTALLAVLDGQL